MKASEIPKLFDGGPEWRRLRLGGEWVGETVSLAGADATIFPEGRSATAAFNAPCCCEDERFFSTIEDALTWLRERYREHWRELGKVMGEGGS